MRTSRLQRRVGAITLPILVMALAACGGGTSNSQVASLNGATGNSNALAPTTTLSVQAREQKLLDFAACMRKNGVNMKDPTFDATGNMSGGGFRQQGLDPRSTEFRAGMKACGSIVQGIGFGRGRRGNFDPAKMQAAMNDFTSCLRDHGLTQVKDMTFGRPDGDRNGEDRDVPSRCPAIDTDDSGDEAQAQRCRDTQRRSSARQAQRRHGSASSARCALSSCTGC